VTLLEDRPKDRPNDIPQLDSIDVESIPQLDSRDPTGTADLRAAFERELKDRWQRLDRCLNKAVGIADVLSLSPNGAMALISAADRTKQFRAWLDELLSHLIVAGGDWMRPYLDEAGERASSRAAGLDPRKAAGGGLPTAPRIAGHTSGTRAFGACAETSDSSANTTSASTTSKAPATLYVNRPLLNADEVIAWAKGQGFETTLSADGMHVTVCFSKTPVDWNKFEPKTDTLTVIGGDRNIREFGDAKVMLFDCPDLSVRHDEFMAGGGSHDFDEYRPHLTISYGDLDESQLDDAYRGPLVFGPEVFAPVNEDWKASIVEDSATEDTMSVLATSELQGICDAYAQQATRIAAHAALVRWRPAKAAQGIRQLTATVGLARSRMMADYLIVKAFGCATLEAFREAGVRHVGTVAEMLPHAHLDDAARKTPQHRHPVHGRFITKTEATREWGRRSSGKFGKAPKAYNRSIAHRRALRTAAAAGEEEVNVQTAGDDKVCQACQTISNNGPYPIDEAMDLIPAHPNCRCAYVPAGFGAKQ
jgi:hypothetical protein